MLCKGRPSGGKRCRAINLNTAGYCWVHWQIYLSRKSKRMKDLFIIKNGKGDSIGYVTIHSNGIQFQADDDFYTGKLNTRESIALALEILNTYAVEYSMLSTEVKR
jgi:hypothetical protein